MVQECNFFSLELIDDILFSELESDAFTHTHDQTWKLMGRITTQQVLLALAHIMRLSNGRRSLRQDQEYVVCQTLRRRQVR